MSKASVLTKSQKEQHGVELIQWYWDAMSEKPSMSFDAFINQIFWDAEMGKNYRSQDLADLGMQLATYLLDHPFPDIDKVKENLEDLANRNPNGMVPTKWALGQAVVNAASEASIFDYFNLTSEAITQTGDEYKQIAVIAAGGFAVYKMAALAVAGLGAIAVIMQMRRKA